MRCHRTKHKPYSLVPEGGKGGGQRAGLSHPPFCSEVEGSQWRGEEQAPPHTLKLIVSPWVPPGPGALGLKAFHSAAWLSAGLPLLYL